MQTAGAAGIRVTVPQETRGLVLPVIALDLSGVVSKS